VCRQFEVYFKLGDPPGIGRHHLGDPDAHSFQRDMMRSCSYSHDGSHTAAQGGGQQVGRRKCFPFSLIVNRCVGNYRIAGSEVCRRGAKFAEVRGMYGFHGAKVIRGKSIDVTGIH